LKLNVLVSDDDTDIRTSLRFTAENAITTAIDAHDGGAAFAWLAQKHPASIALDVGRPRTDLFMRGDDQSLRSKETAFRAPDAWRTEAIFMAVAAGVSATIGGFAVDGYLVLSSTVSLSLLCAVQARCLAQGSGEGRHLL